MINQKKLYSLAISTTAIFFLLLFFLDSPVFATAVVRQITVTTASRTEELRGLT